MTDILVLQHMDCEHLGRIAGVLDEKDLTYRYVRADRGEPIVLADIRGLVVMGGPMGVYEQDRYPFLADELRAICEAIERQIPVLGVCLGAQLIAAALGADVRPSGNAEIGWHNVSLKEDASTDGLFGGLPRQFPAFHWHGDIFELPAGAVSLAESEVTPCQAFRFGDRIYALQFHPEITEAIIADWIEAFGSGLNAAGITAEELGAATVANLPAYCELSHLLFQRWAELL